MSTRLQKQNHSRTRGVREVAGACWDISPCDGAILLAGETAVADARAERGLGVRADG